MSEIITIENNSTLKILGATKVLSSTPNQGVVQTEQNKIVITGSDLEVKNLDLDSGSVTFEGKVTNVKFSGKNEKPQSLLKRLFK